MIPLRATYGRRLVAALLLCMSLAPALADATDAATLARIHNQPASTTRVPVTRVDIFRGTGHWTYAHHPAIAYFRGQFYAMWSNGHVDEDQPGQRVLIARSADFSAWSRPLLRIGDSPGEAKRVHTAVGFRATSRQLAAYYSSYEYASDGRMVLVKTFVRTSTDGERWSAAREIEMPVVANQAPRQLASGRLVLAGHVTFPYTDDPDGVQGFREAGIYQPAAALVPDSPGNIRAVAEAARWGDGVVLCEGSFMERPDGSVWMFLRSMKDHLWVTESTDRGATWSRPVATRFADDNARFRFGTLERAGYWYVGNPRPGSGRTPLVFATSENGMAFDRWVIVADEPRAMRTPGRHKGGLYAYPDALIRDGYVYVVASVNKEDIAGFRFRLPER